MNLRAYRESDAQLTLDVFRRAIRETASRDYTAEQVAAWASDDIDAVGWAAARRDNRTHVAEWDGRVVGFTDLDDHGYVDMLYVAPEYGRRGVASALLEWIVATARECGIDQLTTHASLSARPFFEAHGFTVVAERRPVLRGVTFTNFAMMRATRSGGQ